MSPSVDDVVAEVARVINADLPALSAEMARGFVEVLPEFRQDDSIRRLMEASTAANLAALVDMLAHAIPVEQITVPPAAAAYAQRFAQQNLSLEALLRAYRLGERLFEQWSLAALARMEPLGTALALAAHAELASRTASYIDQVIDGLSDIFEAERRRWNSRSGAARAAQIRLVLESEHLDEESASELLGLRMDGWHQAAVIWLPAGDAQRNLQAGARQLAGAAGGSALMTMLCDEHTLWAWISGLTPVDVDLVALEGHTGTRIALGAPARGLAGFRATLREALRARTVAEAAGERVGNVVDFDDVAVAGLLNHDDGLRHWVERVLPGLTGDDPAARQLRMTLRVFLELGGSYTQAAARLHLHKNTVHYRVRKAEELRGRPLTEDRLAVEVALLAADLVL